MTIIDRPYGGEGSLIRVLHHLSARCGCISVCVDDRGPLDNAPFHFWQFGSVTDDVANSCQILSFFLSLSLSLSLSFSLSLSRSLFLPFVARRWSTFEDVHFHGCTGH